MRYIDIHTHSIDREQAIINCHLTPIPDKPCSVGIHPWHISDDYNMQLLNLRKAATDNNVTAIGECGFDFIKSTATKELQQEIFTAHIALSEELDKPLIIHQVKGEELLLKANKMQKHKQAWIIHGFRGKPQQASNFINAGMYLSYGEHFNHESLRMTPLDRILIESDESRLPIEEIYNKIASTIGMTKEELNRHIIKNIQDCNIDADTLLDCKRG